jgi:hypothetical protein
MIKVAGMLHGKPLLILGLSGENMTRLMADEPMLIHAADLDLPDIEIVIVGGRTEHAIMQQLREVGLAP